MIMDSNQLNVDIKMALEKEKKLLKLLGSCERALVAYSGGVDSSYLLYKASLALGQDNVLAVTVQSELSPPEEIEEAAKNALTMNIVHQVLKIDLLKIPGIVENSPERCYICKNYIYKNLRGFAEESNYAVVLDGSNADDKDEYRPGLRALKELGIKSPLVEAGLGKKEIRYLSKQAGLTTWDKPAAACLASRLCYGDKITPAKLELVARAEKYLRQLGVKDNIRVRYHGNLARIEVDEKDIELLVSNRELVVNKLGKLGFLYVTLDLSGFQSGSMDRMVRYND